MSSSTAVYTTVYPGVEGYLADWYRSIVNQTDTDFDLVICVDSLDRSALNEVFRQKAPAELIDATGCSTPAEVRQKAFQKIVDRYDKIVLVDSDDVLFPTRVEHAKRQLKHVELTVCGMALIDHSGRSLPYRFGLDEKEDIRQAIVKKNMFGLSNTAYTSGLLKNCLPIPSECVLVDWYLATKACFSSDRIGVDPAHRMFYRQHENNIARIIPPFTVENITQATKLVLQHCSLVIQNIDFENQEIAEQYRRQFEYVTKFDQVIRRHTAAFNLYLQRLNETDRGFTWWEMIANEDLENVWIKYA